MPQDNPSPEMLEMRANAIERMNKANETVEKALKKVKEATQALKDSHAAANSEEGRELYAALKCAQERYATTYEEEKRNFDDAASYFEANPA